jgi:transcriptional regulator with XRE-family HTH domain
MSWILTMATVQVKKVVEVVSNFPGLGDRIRAARKISDKGVTALAAEAGISRTYWYELENERLHHAASEAVIRKVEAALGADLGVDFGDEQ